MKKTLSIKLFSFLFLTASLGYSQMGTEEKDANRYISNKPITITSSDLSAAGSVYENKEFVNGYVFKNGKTLASNVPLRYNAKRDEIEVKTGMKDVDKSARVLVKNEDIYIKILNKMFVYTPVKDGIDKAGYFVVLQEGDHFALYKKITKVYIEGREAVNSITRDSPASYKNKETFYLVNKADGSFKAFPKSRKGKLKVFTKDKKAVKEFVKENRLNLNKGYALAKLVQYYDTL
ncbi:MAG: hypothetical protein AAFP76_07335 [Bacteroidota bacterium]